MSEELVSLESVGARPLISQIKQSLTFKKGALSDETKYPTERLVAADRNLRMYIRSLLKIFAYYASDQQIERMGPILASLVKTLEESDGNSKNKLTGGGPSMWDEAFSVQKGGVNGDSNSQSVPAASTALITTSTPAMPQAGPAASTALTTSTPAMLQAAPANIVVPQLTPLERAQLQQMDVQTALLQSLLKERESSQAARDKRNKLIADAYDRAQTINKTDILSTSILFALSADLILLALLSVVGEGAAGLTAVIGLLLIQIHSATKYATLKNFFGAIFSLAGGTVVSAVTALSTGLANTMTGLLGMGSVTDDIQQPTITSAVGGPADAVLVPGRGFTPASGFALASPGSADAKFAWLFKVQTEISNAKFIVKELFKTFFGLDSDDNKLLTFGVPIAVVIVSIYLFYNLFQVRAEVKRRDALAEAKYLESTAPPALPTNLGSTLGPSATNDGTSILSLVRPRGGIKKKRRTFRNHKSSRKRRTFAY